MKIESGFDPKCPVSRYLLRFHIEESKEGELFTEIAESFNKYDKVIVDIDPSMPLNSYELTWISKELYDKTEKKSFE